MNERVDLRRRINKIRSRNNLEPNEDKFSKHLKMEPKKTDEKEIQKSIKQFQDKITENEEINREFIPPKEEIVNPNTLFQKKQINKNEDKNFNSDYEVQFKLLANKFNESVEVILELSEKVNKLEKLLYSEIENKSYRAVPFNLRLISIILVIFILGYSFSFIDIDTTLIKEIIKDILTGI